MSLPIIKTKTPTLRSREGTIDFYKDRYQTVILVTCGDCGSELCLWVGPPKNVQEEFEARKSSYPGQLFRVNLSDALLGSVLRLDGAHGYQCYCGKDTRSFPIEEQVCPPQPRNKLEELEGTGMPPQRTAFDDAQIKDQIDVQGWQPDVKVTGRSKDIEGFVEERVQG